MERRNGKQIQHKEMDVPKMAKKFEELEIKDDFMFRA